MWCVYPTRRSSVSAVQPGGATRSQHHRLLTSSWNGLHLPAVAPGLRHYIRVTFRAASSSPEEEMRMLARKTMQRLSCFLAFVVLSLPLNLCEFQTNVVLNHWTLNHCWKNQRHSSCSGNTIYTIRSSPPLRCRCLTNCKLYSFSYFLFPRFSFLLILISSWRF